MAKEACGMRGCQMRPIYMAEETCIYGKRGLYIWQKRPTYMARDLYIWQKRPICAAKETYRMAKETYWYNYTCPHTLTYLHTHTYTNYKHTCRPPFSHPLPSLNHTRTCLLRLSPLIPLCRHVPPPFYGGQSDRGV